MVDGSSLVRKHVLVVRPSIQFPSDLRSVLDDWLCRAIEHLVIDE